MTAIASYAALPLDDPDARGRTFEIDVPELRPHDILVRVQAVSANPVDLMKRSFIVVSLFDTDSRPGL